MKQAIVVGLDGLYLEPTIVKDEQSGVEPLYAPGDDHMVVIAYSVAVPTPEGLYLPCWDFDNEEWVEGRTEEEIAVIQAAPLPETPEQRIAALETELQAAKEAAAVASQVAAEASDTQQELLELLIELGVIA
jgi:hypothetical protein